MSHPYNLVFNQNGAALTNSLLVAEKFGKQHSHVLRTIKDLIIANPKMDLLFISTTYDDEQGKPRVMYIMNRDGFTLLVYCSTIFASKQ
uniref:Rha family transcriptional regulator n=1 Tax=uncultured Dysgonomonas sp. TaxID=206096 RepID=UPI00345CFFC1